MKMHTV